MKNQMQFTHSKVSFRSAIFKLRRDWMCVTLCTITAFATIGLQTSGLAADEEGQPKKDNVAAKNVATKEEPKPLLTLSNGNVLAGAIVKATQSSIVWNADLLRGNLEFDIDEINRIQFPGSASHHATKEKYCVQTTQGDKFYGDVTRVDQNGLHLRSARHGQLTVAQKCIFKVVNLSNVDDTLPDLTDLKNWKSLNETKEFWKVSNSNSDSGEVRSTRHYINLVCASELPDGVRIDLTVEWRKKLDFVFGFGAPESKEARSDLPRIESQKNSLVLRQKDNLVVIYDSLDAKQREVTLQIQWDRKNNTITIHNQQGEELCSLTDIPDQIPGIEPGIYFENKRGDVKIKTLHVNEFSFAYDGSKSGAQLTDGTGRYGELKTFDGTNWNVVKAHTEAGEQPADQLIAAEDFRSAIVNLKGSQVSQGANTFLRFQDGATLKGELVSMTSSQITLKSECSDQPISSELVGISLVRFSEPADTEKPIDIVGKHLLRTSHGMISGRVVAGTGKPGDVIRWQPTGSRDALPLANADAKIILSNTKATPSSKGDKVWPDKIYLKNKDTLPGRIESIDSKHIVFESFAGSHRLSHDMVKAVDLANLGGLNAVSCQDVGWYFSEEATQNVGDEKNVAAAVEPRTENEIVMRAPGRFGHSKLASPGTLKFNLKWKKHSLTTLEVRQFVHSPDTASGGIGASVAMWDNCIIIRNLKGERVGESRPVMTPSRKAEISMNVTGDILSVSVNGQKKYSTKVNPGDIKGNAVSMNLKLFRTFDPTHVILKDISVEQSGAKESSVFVDSENLERLLTIPRFRTDSPPKQILFGRNFDLLRGDLVSLDSNQIRFQSRLDDFTFDRNLVSSIVWLHAETLTELKDEPKNIEATKIQANPSNATANPSDQVVQAVLKDGRRLTVTAKKWTDKTLDGFSEALGDCSVSVANIKELRIGRVATDASDIAYADWVPKAARSPEYEDVAAGGATFGSPSSLVGTPAKDFQLTLLDGSEFKLSEQRGKVVVIDFWATWCGPCMRALPEMIRATGSFDPNQVVFIGANQSESPKAVEAFLKRKGWKFQVGLDDGKVADLFDVHGIPQSVIIDKAGKIAFLEVGAGSDVHDKMFHAIQSLAGDSALIEAEAQ